MNRVNHLICHLTAASTATSNVNLPFHQFLFQQYEKSNDTKQIVLQNKQTGARYTYTDLKQESLALATALASRGIKTGATTAIYINDDVIECPIVVLACSILQVKLLVVPSNTATKELAQQLQSNQVTLIFINGYSIPQIQQCQQLGNKQLKRIILFDPLRPIAASEYYRQLIVSASKPKVPQVKYDAQQDVLLISGSQKITHQDMIQMIEKQQSQGQSHVIEQLQRLLKEKAKSQ